MALFDSYLASVHLRLLEAEQEAPQLTEKKDIFIAHAYEDVRNLLREVDRFKHYQAAVIDEAEALDELVGTLQSLKKKLKSNNEPVDSLNMRNKIKEASNMLLESAGPFDAACKLLIDLLDQ